MLRPQDILVTLKLVVVDAPPTYNALGEALGISASQAYQAVQRAIASGFIHRMDLRVNTDALHEFLIHGVRYMMPPVKGAIERGMPTAYSAAPLKEQLTETGVPLVWPDPAGHVRGETLVPIYKTAPTAAMQDPVLYELLALVDALRVGRARERQLATELLAEALFDAAH